MQAPPRANCDMDYFLVWVRRKIHHAVWKDRHPSLLWIMNRDGTCEVPIEIPEEVVTALIEQGKPESGEDLPATLSPIPETTATQQAILNILGDAPGPLKLTTICQKAGIPANSHARTSIKKLVDDGRVRHFTETHRYWLTGLSDAD